MPHVALGVEADEVRAQQPAHHLLAPRQREEDLRRRETGCAGSSRCAPAGSFSRSICGHQQQLVVVHPDGVAGPVVLDHLVGEALVHPAVHLPVAVVQRDAVQHVVEQGPEDAVAEALVEAAHLRRAERERDAAQLGQAARRACVSCSGLKRETSPGHPTHRPSDCAWGPARPVASPPELRETRTRPCSRRAVTGRRLETNNKRDINPPGLVADRTGRVVPGLQRHYQSDGWTSGLALAPARTLSNGTEPPHGPPAAHRGGMHHERLRSDASLAGIHERGLPARGRGRGARKAEHRHQRRERLRRRRHALESRGSLRCVAGHLPHADLPRAGQEGPPGHPTL